MPSVVLLQGMVMDRIAMRGKLAACIARLQGSLVSKALHTWKAQYANEVVPWLTSAELWSVQYRPTCDI